MKIKDIKFKAKRLDGKGWVCGYFYEENDNTYIIENRQKESKLNRNLTYQVDPSTVCMFTGLKVRLAKKIMKYRSGSFLYDLMRLEGLDVSKELSKIKQYWEPRLALYYATKGGCYGRVDHRIVKAEKITARYSRKLMNCLNRLAGKILSRLEIY